jgi:proline iminopeptidase
MKRVVIVVIILVLGIAAGVGVYLYSLSIKPLYEPGNVRSGIDLTAPLDPPVQPSEDGFWLVEPGIRLHEFSAGNGTPALVIHGGPGMPFTQPLPGLAPLTGQYRFYYYDQRGSGRSTRPIDQLKSSDYYQNMLLVNQKLGVGAQLADIERIRRILGQDQIILIGHSFGGFLATMYAAEFPEHVKALILVDPAEILVMPPPDGGLFNQVNAILPEDQKKGYLTLMSTYLDYGNIFVHSDHELTDLNNQFAGYYAQAAKIKGYNLPAASDPSLSGGWSVQGMYLSLGQRHDYRAALKNVTAPALVIHGEKDIQPAQDSQLYASLLAHAQFALIPNAGHFPFDDQPDQFARVVGQFLNSLQ